MVRKRSVLALAAIGLFTGACNFPLPSPENVPSPSPSTGTDAVWELPTLHPSTAPPGVPQDYVIFSVNVQDFSYPDLSAETLRRLIRLHEQYRVPVDIYLTSTMVDVYEARAPDVLALLRDSQVVAISYHVRPPSPYARDYDWLGLSEQSPQQQYETILEYETHGIDLRTGRPTESSGGYQKLADVMGYPPYVAATLNDELSSTIHRVFEDLGARFAVTHGVPVDLGQAEDGLYLRPEHVDLRLYEHVGGDVSEVIQGAVNEAHAGPSSHAPYFIGIKIHDNDFFAEEAAFTSVYLGGQRQPPWTLGRRADLLSPEAQGAMWALYESAVTYVASHTDRLAPVNAPMVLLLEDEAQGARVTSSPSSGPTVAPTEGVGRPRWVPGTLYLTVVSHNEEPSNRRPDYLRDETFYRENRGTVVRLVEMLSEHGAAYNFQSDWNFLQAVAQYDRDEVLASTGGVNLLQWMAAKGVEIDPHAHESRYNYADVAYLIEQLGVTPSKTVGGFLYDPPDNPQGWEKHWSGLTGSVYPSYSWKANVLWGASTSLHEGSDDLTSGAWIPRNRTAFYEHDPDGSLVYLGGCTSDAQGALALLDAIESGQAPQDGFYTASITVIQDFIDDRSMRELEDFLVRMEPRVEEGAVQWIHLSDLASMWISDYGGMPFQYACSE